MTKPGSTVGKCNGCGWLVDPQDIEENGLCAICNGSDAGES